MILDELRPAKFKGAEFFLRSATTEGGRIIVYDKYPQTDNHSLQDLGREAETFTIEASISNPNYIDKRAAMINALNSEGAGILSHPFYGDINVRHTGKWRINETLNNLGEALISLTFIIEPKTIFPAPAIAQNQSLIKDKTDIAISKAEATLVNKFSMARNSITNLQKAQGKLTKLADTFTAAKNKANNIAQNINDYEQAILDFRNNITELINTPAELAAEITGLFNSLNVLATDPLGQVDMFKAFFNFGDDDESFIPNTADKLERLQNQEALNQAVKVSSLSFAYENSALVYYLTTEEIDEVKNSLEAQYNAIEAIVQDPDTIEALDDLRKEARIFFDKEILQAYKISIARIEKMPCTALAYMYYGNTDFWETLLELNEIRDPAFMGGNLRILTR